MTRAFRILLLAFAIALAIQPPCGLAPAAHAGAVSGDCGHHGRAPAQDACAVGLCCALPPAGESAVVADFGAWAAIMPQVRPALSPAGRAPALDPPPPRSA